MSLFVSCFCFLAAPPTRRADQSASQPLHLSDFRFVCDSEPTLSRFAFSLPATGGRAHRRPPAGHATAYTQTHTNKWTRIAKRRWRCSFAVVSFPSRFCQANRDRKQSLPPLRLLLYFPTATVADDRSCLLCARPVITTKKYATNNREINNKQTMIIMAMLRATLDTNGNDFFRWRG